MARVHVAHSFRRDLGLVESERVFNDILNTVDLLKVIPTMGSKDVPESIRKAFDGQVRKIPVNPFDIVTIYHEADDLVEVAALVHQCASW